MRKRYALLLLVPLTLYVAWARNVDYREFAVLDQSGEERFVFRFPDSSLMKYPGWAYRRSGSITLELWYPSLQDKQSVNYWISSRDDIEASKRKPTPADRPMSIYLGPFGISRPEATLDPANRPPQCRTVKRGETYTADGERFSFQRYILDTPANARAYITYLPTTPIRGVYCLTCIEQANCQLHGVTDMGIPYSAMYREEAMPREAMAIHDAVEAYLQGKLRP